MRTVAIFCSVVDNFGDIGICWRLARQLAHEHQWQVQLYVDDLASFAKICPQVKVDATNQTIFGIQVLIWHTDLVEGWQADFTEQADLATPDVVIEALACTVPEAYLQRVAKQNPQALWLNFEYLSAEDWVEGCHGLPSPQSQVPLTKYFFFPGFTSATGGLLRERDIVQQAQNLQQDSNAQAAFWQKIGIDDALAYQRRISLFAYGQANIASWLTQLQLDSLRTLLLVPQGVLAEQVCSLYPELASQQTAIKRLALGQLTIMVMPFIAQQDYDLLLACCDINFVRGEDSVIRAHWAGRPFIWQIYRQEEQAHRQKLNDFLAKQLALAAPELGALLQKAHDLWDLELDFAEIWPEYLNNLEEIQNHTLNWQQFLTQQQDLASNLVRFAEKKLIMLRNFS
jgi:uncharacterized repeat protein (TIGR03837 family)